MLCSVVKAHRRVLRSKITKARIIRPPDVSEETAAQRFLQTFNQWKSSEAWTTIKRLLQARFSHRVDELIMFAGGRLSTAWVEEAGQYPPSPAVRSRVQHSLPLLLRDVFRGLKLWNESAVCYAQDPKYTNVDIAVLKRNDVTVLDDPDGFLRAESTSCVLSFAPDAPVRQIIIDIARPALLIWDSLERGGSIHTSSDHEQ